MPEHKPVDGPPPFTPEVAEEWLLRLEDIATMERDEGFAARFVLGNLLGYLIAERIIDGPRFFQVLKQATPMLEAANERLAVEAFLGDLEWQIAAGSPDNPGSSSASH